MQKYMAVAQFNSEENKDNILKVPVLTNSVKVQQKLVDLINQLQQKQKQKGRIIPLHVRKQQAIQLINQKENSNQR